MKRNSGIIRKQVKELFSILKPTDIKILNIFFRDGITYVERISDELGEKHRTSYSRHVQKLLRKHFLKKARKERAKGDPQLYSITTKGLLVLLFNKNVSFIDVSKKMQQTFTEEYDNLFGDLDPNIVNEVWKSSVIRWLETQAKTRVNLSKTHTLDIVRSIAQTVVMKIPDILRTLDRTTISKTADIYKRLARYIPIFETYPIGHCDLLLKLNLPMLNFKDIEQQFTEYLYQNEANRAKTLLENALKSKSQITYHLRCKHFIWNQNGKKKCAISNDCSYTNFLLCPKVKESLESALKP